MQPRTVHLDFRTLKLLKHWTWQFVILRPVCSLLMIALQLLGWYTSPISWFFTIVLNVSVSLALYSLVVFYHVFDKELAPHKPLVKFLCIKGIVFFCFWQVMSSSSSWSVKNLIQILELKRSFYSFVNYVSNVVHSQGIVLEILVAAGIIRSRYSWLDVEHIEEGIQNVLVCVEMVVFSVLQQYAYSVQPYSGDVGKWKAKKNE